MMEMMDFIALWIGRIVMIVFGYLTVTIVTMAASNELFKQIQRYRSRAWLLRAIRHYEKIEPRPARLDAD